MKAVLLLLASVLSLPRATEASFDYCTVECYAGPDKPPSKHTMCTHKNEEPGALCVAFDRSKMLQQRDKDAILQLHNELRAKIATGSEPSQPSASNMMELIWDDELETIARRWALQCYYEHDTCRSTKDKVICGQNLAVSSVSRGSRKVFTNSYLDQIKGWYSEFTALPRDMIDKFRARTPEEQMKGMVGHYTQLVWAKSSKMGCERVYFDFTNTDYNPPKHWGMTEYLVCVYLHGNMLNDPIYRQGKPCNECPNDEPCSLTYPGLCSNPQAKLISYPKRPKTTVKPKPPKPKPKPPKPKPPKTTVKPKPPKTKPKPSKTGVSKPKPTALRPDKYTTKKPPPRLPQQTVGVTTPRLPVKPFKTKVRPAHKPQWMGGQLMVHKKHRKTRFRGWRQRITPSSCAAKHTINHLTLFMLLLVSVFVM